MNEIDGIIKLLVEDTEYEIAQYITDNLEKLIKSVFYTFWDTKRRKVVVSLGATDKYTVMIRDFNSGLQKTYYDNKVTIMLKD